MAVINFPNPAGQTPLNTFSPTSTPSATSNGVTYLWTDGSWSIQASSSGGGGGGIEEAPVDGKQYGREDAGWTEITGGGGGGFSGDYNDLTNKPDIPDSTNDLTNDSGFITAADVPSDTDELTEGSTNKYFPEAPTDGKQYARQNSQWKEVVATGGGDDDLDIVPKVRQVFTATAGQTVFALSGDDEFTDGTEQVFRNGSLLALTTDYTTSGNNTVTLAMPAFAEDVVEIYCINALPGGGTDGASDAADVSYTYPGGVEQTVQDRLEQSVSVLDFGADPTGNTPSDDAFENALAASRKVFVPFGTYKITKPIQITKSYQALVGDDSLPTIYHENSDQSQAIEFVANSGFVLQYNVIKNLFIQGNQTKDVNYPTAGSAGPQHAAISLSSISRDAYGFATTLIENVRMGHFPIGIYNHGTVDATFRRNRVQWLSTPKGTPVESAICAGYFFRAERMGDGRSPQASCTVDQCLCGWSTTPDAVNSYGVYLVGDDLRDIWIYDLNLATCKYGIWIEGDSNLIAANDIHISKPIIDKSEVGIYVKNVNQNSAVSINGGWFTNKRDSTVPLVRIENSRGVTLSDFQIFGTLSSTSRGIQLDSSSINNTIKAGTIYDQNEGIILNNVQYNYLSDISILQSEAFGANNFTTGVFILGGASNNTLSNIYIDGGPTRPYTQGFRIGADTPNNTLENCTAGEFVTTPHIIADDSTFFTSYEKGTAIYRSLPTSSVDLEKGGLYSSGGNLKIVDDNPDTVSVTDFGASPDADAATNTAAIQAAIDAAPGQTIYIPAGTYKINDTLRIRASGTTIKGENRDATKLRQYDLSKTIIDFEAGHVYCGLQSIQLSYWADSDFNIDNVSNDCLCCTRQRWL